MKHYNYQAKLYDVWKKAVSEYESGNREADRFFDDQETAFLNAIGQTAQEFYDYAEDYVRSEEPDFGTVAAVADIRRSYFLENQQGQSSTRQLETESLPSKEDSVRGIPWLPRILPKAKAKIFGELNPDLMYGCGGDRNFFRENDIHPAEFLRIVLQNLDNDEAVIDWVEKRRKAAQG